MLTVVMFSLKLVAFRGGSICISDFIISIPFLHMVVGTSVDKANFNPVVHTYMYLNTLYPDEI